MPDIAGNSLGTATPLNLTSSLQTFPDTVTPTANDYYRFSLSFRSSLNLSLTGLTADANLTLLDRAGNPFSISGIPQTSTNVGNFAESINTILDPGTYYIRVSTGPSISTADYSLNIAAVNNVRTDLLWRNYATGVNGIWYMNSPIFEGQTGPIQNIPDTNWQIQGTGDFNLDGQSDILWRNVQSGRNGYWLMNGLNLITSVEITQIADLNWRMLGAGDFNGDRQADIYWTNPTTGQVGIWIMNGRTYQSIVQLPRSVDTNWKAQTVGDFNQDGTLDLAWRNSQTGQAGIWLLNGASFQATRVGNNTDPNWTIQGSGDFNQDGITDLFWRNQATGANGIWLLNRTTFVSAYSVTTVGDLKWQAAAPFNRITTALPIDVVGNTLPDAFNLGSNLSGNGIYRGAIGSEDPNDYYQFNLGTRSNITLSLTNLASNLDLELRDATGAVIRSSNLTGVDPEAISLTLDTGTYYARIFGTNSSSPYTFGLGINNLPILATNTGISVTEGAAATVTGTVLKVTDGDNTPNQLIYTLGSLPTNGSFSFNGAALTIGSTFTQASLDTGSGLLYSHNGSESLTDTFSFTVSDGVGGSLSNSTFTFNVVPVNDPPVLTIPTAPLSADQGANFTISGISIADPDVEGRELTVTVTAGNGVLSLGSTQGLTFTQGDGSQDAALVFRGSLVAVNTALRSLIYRSNDTFQGTDTINLVVNDNGNTGIGGAQTDSETLPITVTPVNKPPLITLPTIAPTVNEDTSQTLAGITINDLDAGSGNLQVSLFASNGVLSLANNPGVTFITGDGVQDRNLVFSGPLSVINAALSSLVYLGDKDFNGTDSVLISVNDQGNTGNGIPLSDTKTLNLTVSPVNDKPTLTVPPTQAATENVNLTIPGVSISDVDAGNGALTLNLTAGNGILSIGSTPGVTFTNGTTNQSSTLILSGTLSALNSALQTLTYRSNNNFSGTDSIAIDVNDNGSTGSGIVLSDSKTIAITILSTNSAPVITLPPAPATNAGQDLAISGISISDPDIGTGIETVTISASNGVLSLTPNPGIEFLQGNGTQNSRITFRGSLASVNTALASLVYRANTNFQGFDPITVSVSDQVAPDTTGIPLSDTKTLFVNVGGAVNQLPNVVNDIYSITRNTPLVLNSPGVLSNDADPEGFPLSAALVSNVSNGTLSFNPNGSFTYRPNASFVGTDSFTYRANDGISDSEPATVVINVTNNAPVANNDTTYSSTRNQPLTVSVSNGVLANDTDPDQDALTAVAGTFTSANGGTLSLNANGSFTYTPATNFAGVDSFTYQATDGLLPSNTATISITVNPGANLAPTVTTTTGSLSYTENQAATPIDPTLTVTDIDSPNLAGATVSIANGFTTGQDTLSFTGSGPITGNYNASTGILLLSGVASLADYQAALRSVAYSNNSENPSTANRVVTFTVNDGATSNNSASGTRSITVAAVNDAPIATNDLTGFNTTRNNPLTITAPGVLVNDTDPESSPLTVAAGTFSSPNGGTLSLNPNGSFTYTPASNFVGTDSFTYQIGDGSLLSNTATINLTVGAANTAPTATSDAYSTTRNQLLTVTADQGVLTNDRDAENDPLTLTAGTLTSPNGGTLSLNANGAFLYTPANNFVGTDSFTYQVTDGTLPSNAATITITVNQGVNAAPIVTATAGSLSYTENQAATPIDLGLTVTDSDNPTLTGATVAITSGFTSGQDTLTFATNTAGITGNFNPTTGVLLLSGSATLAQYQEALRSIAYSNGSENPSTTDRAITFTVNDGSPSSNLGSATRSITVSAVNDAPIATNDLTGFATSRNTPLTITAPGVLVNDSDPENSPLTVAAGTFPSSSGGSLSLNPNGSFTYTPANNFVGTDTFTYQIGDGSLLSNTATINITVTQANTPPTVQNDTSYVTGRNTPLSVATAQGVLTNDSDSEQTTLTAVPITTTSANGSSLTLNANGSFTYTPGVGFVGSDTFTYRANDGFVDSTNLGTIVLSVTAGTNTAPIANNNTYQVTTNTPLQINTNQGILSDDNDADPLTAIRTSNPNNGSLTLNNDGSFVYTPNANFTAGVDSFTYQASDGLLNSNTATVFLSVGANVAPVASNDFYRAAPNRPLSSEGLSGGVLSNDTDQNPGTQLTAIPITTSSPSGGSLSLNADGSFTYTPASGITLGTDTFTYRASDGALSSNTATIVFSISPNTAPVAANVSYRALSGTPLTIDSLTGVRTGVTDSDPDTQINISASRQVSPSGGTLSLNTDGSFTYTPASGFTGIDTFTYQASDGIDPSNPASVFISVVTNSAPVVVNDTYQATVNKTLTVTLPGVLTNDTDADGINTLTAFLQTEASQGAVNLSGNGAFTYVPRQGFQGVDSFTYRVNDGFVNAFGTVTVSVNPNAAPIAVADTYNVNRNSTLTVPLANSVLQNDTDADQDSLSVVVPPSPITTSNGGTVTLSSNGTFVYTPATNFTGTDSFTYLATDGTNNSAPGTVNISIRNTSSPPIAGSDSYSTSANNPFTVAIADSGVLKNDTDTDNDPLSVIPGVLTSSNGTLSLNSNGTFSYTPNANFKGTDTFTYQVTDGVNTVPGAITLTVGATNSAPIVTVPGNQTSFQNSSLAISGLSITDVDAGNNPIQVTLTATNGNLLLNPPPGLTVGGDGNGSRNVILTGTLAAINAGLASLTYTPTTPFFTGTDTINITANDQGFTGGANPPLTGTGSINVTITTGPVLLRDINSTPTGDSTPEVPKTLGSNPANFIAVGNTLYFTADDDITGTELWKSDGTLGGTTLAADINTSPDSGSPSSPSNLTVVGTTLFFSATNGINGVELWKLEAGATTPTLVKDINLAGDSTPANLVNFNGILYFRANDGSGNALWRSDGTTAGTFKVGTGITQPGNLTVVGNNLFFRAGTGGGELWKTDGTTPTQVVNLGATAAISNLITIGNTLFFTATNSTNGTELWLSNGTAAGTRRVSDITVGAGSSNPTNLVNQNGTLYFFARNGSTNGLYKSTEAGVVTLVQALPSGGQAPTSLTVVGSTLYFVVDAGTGGTLDRELWKTDGTTATRVKDINPSGNAAPTSLTNLNGVLYFIATDGVGTKLWRSDGTEAGTTAISTNFGGATPGNLTAVGGKLYFSADSGTSGTELWVL